MCAQGRAVPEAQCRLGIANRDIKLDNLLLAPASDGGPPVLKMCDVRAPTTLSCYWRHAFPLALSPLGWWSIALHTGCPGKAQGQHDYAGAAPRTTKTA